MVSGLRVSGIQGFDEVSGFNRSRLWRSRFFGFRLLGLRSLEGPVFGPKLVANVNGRKLVRESEDPGGVKHTRSRSSYGNHRSCFAPNSRFQIALGRRMARNAEDVKLVNTCVFSSRRYQVS